MASDITYGLTGRAHGWTAPCRVAAMGSQAAVRSRLALALCLLLAAALGAAGVSACGGSSTASVSPEAVVSGTPVALATSAAAQEFHGMLPVVFTQSLIKKNGGGSSKTVGDVVQMRHVMWTYRNESSDPRLNGRWVVVFNVDQRQADMSGRLWGTIGLSNQGGTWVGKFTGGIATGGDAHHAFATLKGTGDYAGLVSHSSGWFVEAGEGFTPDIEIVNAGWIETSDGSAVPPAPGPGTTPANWTPVVGIATMKETAYSGPGPWVWDVEQSDPRVSGRLEGDIEGIGNSRSDGSLDYRVESTISNEDGVWNSPWSTEPMVRGPKQDYEHFQYSKSTGSGAYEGLVYHHLWHYPERESFQPGDTFVWTGWIEEAQ
jgi:hypothetical protein